MRFGEWKSVCGPVDLFVLHGFVTQSYYSCFTRMSVQTGASKSEKDAGTLASCLREQCSFLGKESQN